MFSPESYTIIAALFPRLLGLIYFFSFGAFLFQIRGLIGREGILPLTHYLTQLQLYYPRTRFHIAPTLFWFNASDTALIALVSTGTFFAICLMLGLFTLS